MHGLRSTTILLIALAGLVGYIYFSDSSGSSNDNALPEAFDVSAENIVEVEIRRASGETARVERIDTSWQVTLPMKVPADSVQVAAVTSALANLSIQRVVDESPTDLAQYGLDPPRIEVAFRRTGETDFERLLIGERTPTGGDLYAKTPDQSRVFLISSFLDATFNKTAFDFRDKSLLEFDSAAITGVEIARDGQLLRFARNGSEWRVAAPFEGRADYTVVEGILTRLSTAQMRTIVEEEATNLRQYGLDRPAVSVTLTGGESPETLLIGNTADGAAYAKDAGRPIVFTVEESLVTELRREAAEFRRKELFDARSFTANRLEIRRNGQTKTLEKANVDGKDVWRTAAGVNVDTTMVDDLLLRLTALRALTFEQNRHPSLSSPLLEVTVRFDTDRTETVTFGRGGDSTDAYASRPDEPGSMRLSATPLEDIVKAVDALP